MHLSHMQSDCVQTFWWDISGIIPPLTLLVNQARVSSSSQHIVIYKKKMKKIVTFSSGLILRDLPASWVWQLCKPSSTTTATMACKCVNKPERPGLSRQSPGRDRDRAGPTNHRARLVIRKRWRQKSFVGAAGSGAANHHCTIRPPCWSRDPFGCACLVVYLFSVATPKLQAATGGFSGGGGRSPGYLPADNGSLFESHLKILEERSKKEWEGEKGEWKGEERS